MTDKGRCDQCEFYEGPPQSDEKGVQNRAFQTIYTPQAYPPGHVNRGTCHAAPRYSRPDKDKVKWPEVDADDWCGMFKEQSL